MALIGQGSNEQGYLGDTRSFLLINATLQQCPRDASSCPRLPLVEPLDLQTPFPPSGLAGDLSTTLVHATLLHWSLPGCTHLGWFATVLGTELDSREAELSDCQNWRACSASPTCGGQHRAALPRSHCRHTFNAIRRGQGPRQQGLWPHVIAYVCRASQAQ